MLLNHACFFIPLRRGATKLCSNPVREAQRSVPGSLSASAISVPEVRHSPEKLRFIQLNVSFFDRFS